MSQPSPPKSTRASKCPAATAAAGEPAKHSKTADVASHAADGRVSPVESELSNVEDLAAGAEANTVTRVPANGTAPLINCNAAVETASAQNAVVQEHEVDTVHAPVPQPAPAVHVCSTAPTNGGSGSEDVLVLPSATTEARTVGLLQALSVEPGVLVGLDLNALKMATMSAASVAVAAPAAAAPAVAAQLTAVTAPIRQQLRPVTHATPLAGHAAVPFPAARTEAEAQANLNALGFEPAAMVGLNLNALNSLHGAILRGKVSDAAASTSQPEGPVAGPSNSDVQAAAVPHHVQSSTFAMSRVLRTKAYCAFTDVLVTGATAGRSRWHKHRRGSESVAVGMDWGVPTSFNNMANYICQKGTSKPITFWVVGVITFGHWFNKDGLAADRVALGIQPLSTTASATCKTLLDTLCVPHNSSYVAAGFGADQIKATRWMTVKAQNGTRNSANASMEKLAVDSLKPHDLVLVEARIGRHTTDAALKGKLRTMDNFQAFFNLESVYLLKSAPSVAVTAMPAGFVFWLWFTKEKDGDLSAPSFHKRIKADGQGWSRIRRLLRLPAPNCIIIFAYGRTPKARDDLESALCLAHVDDVQSATALATFAMLLGDSPVRSIGAIYDSSPDAMHWYYEAFSPIDGGGSPVNLIASAIFGKDIKGDVLLTVTTPGGKEGVQRPMVGCGVIKILWHYLFMKLDVGAIAR
ncbi:hypothetical protein K438DRAFT_2111086 [Mycena galopus ATCC 62051]|nr:hypothetical protein K438DRAFT_2111086 [Mycena galopus ATCC 62051]